MKRSFESRPLGRIHAYLLVVVVSRHAVAAGTGGVDFFDAGFSTDVFGE